MKAISKKVPRKTTPKPAPKLTPRSGAKAVRKRVPAAAVTVTDTSVTLQMVADLAGVSSSTVSRILNGSAKVSPTKQQAVDAAIATLGFMPNPVARGLAGGRTLSIGVVTQSIDSPYYGEGLRGIEAVLGAAGYMPLFASGHWTAADEKKCVDLLLSRRVDGMIMFTGRLPDEMLMQVARRVPTVVTGRQLSGPGLYSLNFANVEAARMATRHLIELGHRRIVHILGPRDHADARERKEGYRRALKEAGIAYDPTLVVQGDFNEASGLKAVSHLIESRIDFSAIFAANDQTAYGAALGLYRRNLRIPDDVALVGFDDLPGSQYSIPPLTTIRQPIYQLGELGAIAVLAMLRGEAPEGELPPPLLVTRESTRQLKR
ncbi:LacI family DNA-binding transcriptional regulator [Rhizobacter sp. OV335]|uniref:LacI family DNA-binding transcriptional regulator n=1 Tax=Rhizobacter sp. OV335 TaxID=1500264 RepID=UPI000920A496|nr:substrate-binding domain-containing protein [Rhizobacter sp. OV335]SHN23966.1 transcriptional regulator, LacI family [Rhizobacter sp. OV335]